jgi:YVTN family beta-propeller protein
MKFFRHRGGRRVVLVAGALFIALLGTAVAIGALATSEHAGPQGDGTAYTSYGWKVTPAGKQVAVGERPYGSAMSPDGKHLLVSNDGVGDQSLQVVDAGSGAVVQTLHYPAPQALFVGVAYSPDGKRAFAAGGDQSVVHTYDVAADGTLEETAPLALAVDDGQGNKLRPFPAGLAVSADGAKLFVADDFDNTLSIFDLATSKETRVALSSAQCVIGDWGDVSEGKNCEFPYTVALSANGKSAYVSDWGQQTVDVVDVASAKLTSKITVGTHPSALALSPKGDHLFVANTDSDDVSDIDTATNHVVRTIALAPYRNAPVGSNPEALSVSPDGSRLYVANAGDNDLAVVDLRSLKGRVKGLIPTGWYPTGVHVSSDGKRLLVLSAKGLGAGPNPAGPNPTKDPESGGDQYIGSMIQGSLAVIDTPQWKDLRGYTDQVRHNDGFDRGAAVRTLGVHQHVVPVRPGDPSPIKHVIVMVNENRTYDQVLGDLGKGNGDPSITLFGPDVAPNHHALSSAFTTLDNTYAVGEVSDDGWEWTAAANANSFTQKTFPTNYGGRGAFYAGEGGTRAAAPGRDPWHAYLWDSLDEAGISYRNYGWWATDVPPVSVYNAPTLAANTDPAYAGFNMAISDQTRFAEWTKEFDGYVASGKLPSVEFIKFPRDHTCGTNPACPTPQAMVADSDYAMGRLVDAVSHSSYWASTAIFEIEDDAQDGPDHVDAHRTVAHVISPYTQTGKVDSTFYSSVSVLRTIELILGVHPLTQFDAAATPMLGSFTDRPNLAPYTAIVPKQPLDTMNTASAPMAAEAASWNFSKEDRAPEDLLNKSIWEGVKGADSPMPAPRHELFAAQRDPDGD